jgi:RNA polymerase sigma-70 factor (ECF subfamily)
MRPPDHIADRVRFRRLYEHTCLHLLRYVTRTIGNVAIAEDIVQETYVRSLAARTLPVNEDEARAYLFRVASNLMVDYWRQRKRIRNRQHEPEDHVAIADPARGIDVSRIFHHLKPQERQLVWLAHVEGEDHISIARILSLKPASVKVLLHRARSRYADLLRDAGYEHSGEINP